jgi:hypothetical protein
MTNFNNCWLCSLAQVWGPRPQFVRTTTERLAAPVDCDVVVCGGTLGIFLATALQLRGE